MSQGFTGQVNTNALNAPFFNGGRLTAASGQPVADATSVGTIYWTPYKSGTISLYNGTNYQTIIASETALALTATSGSVYDVFGYLSGTVMVLESLVWTNTTTRATAVNQDSFGVYSKSTDRTRRYLGTFYASGTNQVTDSTSIRGLWNMDNREERSLLAQDSTDNWTFNSAGAWRAFNNSSTYGVGRVGIVFGLALPVIAEVQNCSYYSASAANMFCGVGVDSTTAPSGLTGAGATPAANLGVHLTAKYHGTPGLGFHYLAPLEYGYNSVTLTYYGDNINGVLAQYAGLSGIVDA